MDWRPTSRRNAALLAIGGVILSAPAAAQTVVELPIDALGAEARAAAEAAAPDAVFTVASMELNENGRHAVEVEGVGGDGRHVEVDLYQDGSQWVVEEIERYVEWDETPWAVRATVSSLFLDSWRPTLIERSVRPNDVVVYEIEGYDAGGELFELEIGRDGSFIAIKRYNAT